MYDFRLSLDALICPRCAQKSAYRCVLVCLRGLSAARRSCLRGGICGGFLAVFSGILTVLQKHRLEMDVARTQTRLSFYSGHSHDARTPYLTPFENNSVAMTARKKSPDN